MANFGKVLETAELSIEQRETLEELLRVFNGVQPRNKMLRDYYEGDIYVPDFGVSINPDLLQNDQVCYWPDKAVNALAERITFDRFVFADGHEDADLQAIMRANRVGNAYTRYLPTKLTFGCMFGVVNATRNGVQIRFHSAQTAAALPDGNHDSGVIGAGFVISKWGRVTKRGAVVPTEIVLYEPSTVTILARIDRDWWYVADSAETPEESPLMFAFAHKSTGMKPFGQSRINKAVRSLTRDAVRTMWHMEVSSAFHAAPKLALLGLDDEQFDALSQRKPQLYMDSVFMSTRDGNGNVPELKQISGNSPQPFIEQLRCLAGFFSGATGVPISSLGIVQDNPISAEAMATSKEDLAIIAEADINADAEVLERMITAALAVNAGKAIDELPEEQQGVIAKFKQPHITSLPALADSITKVGAVAPWFVDTDIPWELMGFTEQDIARMVPVMDAYKAQQELRRLIEDAS